MGIEGKIIKLNRGDVDKKINDDSPMAKALLHLAHTNMTEAYVEKEQKAFLFSSEKKKTIIEKYNEFKKLSGYAKDSNYSLYYENLKNEDIDYLVGIIINLPMNELTNRPACTKALFDIVFEKERKYEKVFKYN